MMLNDDALAIDNGWYQFEPQSEYIIKYILALIFT